MHCAMTTTTIRELVVQYLRANVNGFEIRMLIEANVREYYKELRQMSYASAAEIFLTIWLKIRHGEEKNH